MSIKAEETPFWVVWQPETGLPRVKHYNATLAENEADRLASQNPGRTFYVMAATYASKSVTLHRTRFTDNSEVPF